MGIMVYALLWVMKDFDHQPYHLPLTAISPYSGLRVGVLGGLGLGLGF